MINIKAGRVGGYLNARRIHDLCRANGIPVWCGGMVETGLGRAANAALAALPGFTLTGDISASDRFYEQDITEPFRAGGRARSRSRPGRASGSNRSRTSLEEFTMATEWIQAPDDTWMPVRRVACRVSGHQRGRRYLRSDGQDPGPQPVKGVVQVGDQVPGQQQVVGRQHPGVFGLHADDGDPDD